MSPGNKGVKCAARDQGLLAAPAPSRSPVSVVASPIGPVPHSGLEVGLLLDIRPVEGYVLRRSVGPVGSHVRAHPTERSVGVAEYEEEECEGRDRGREAPGRA